MPYLEGRRSFSKMPKYKIQPVLPDVQSHPMRFGRNVSIFSTDIRNTVDKGETTTTILLAVESVA